MKSFFNSGHIIMPIIFLLAINTRVANAQDSVGIRFEKGLTWLQIKDKAKKENKYIFVDGFTTWCVPCRVMSNEIFPQHKVADFFNKNFINVSVQFDVTKKDNQEVKQWYEDATYIASTYKIDSYPTYLFFSPDGDLVHTIIGATRDADEFIDKSMMALSPQSQYNTLKRKYESGKKDSDFLLSLINAGRIANDKQYIPLYVNEYLSTQKNLLTERNLKFIASSTTKITDPGFDIVLNNPDKIDQLAGKGASSDIITGILFDEIVLPLIRSNGSKKDYGGGMVVYSGEIIKNVDWGKIKEKLDLKYPNFSHATILSSKAIYYQWLNDWTKYTQSVTSYILKYGDKLTYDKINSYAWNILANCQDIQCINSAIEWSRKTIFDKNLVKPYYLYTYSDLLYKAGKKEQSVKFLKDAINASAEANKDLTNLLNKINNNEKTW